jgi:hypothetical protein
LIDKLVQDTQGQKFAVVLSELSERNEGDIHLPALLQFVDVIDNSIELLVKIAQCRYIVMLDVLKLASLRITERTMRIKTVAISLGSKLLLHGPNHWSISQSSDSAHSPEVLASTNEQSVSHRAPLIELTTAISLVIIGVITYSFDVADEAPCALNRLSFLKLIQTSHFGGSVLRSENSSV